MDTVRDSLRARRLVGAWLVLVLIGGGLAWPRRARAQGGGPRWPAAAERRFDEARALGEKGRYAEAAAAYREVAEWPEGGGFSQRPQALYNAGLMLEYAREHEKAIEVYKETERRFPGTSFASIAHGAADTLAQGGARGLEFKRRLEVARDLLLPALARAQRGDVEGARPALEQAIEQLRALMSAFRDDARAKEVALSIGDAFFRLGRLEDAVAYYQDGIALAEREAKKPGAPGWTTGDVTAAQEKLAEARREIVRRRLDRGAKLVLLLLAVGVASTRPWRGASRSTLRLTGGLLALVGGLSLVAAGAARWVLEHVDDHSPISGRMAALLVLGPGVVGVLVSLGLSRGLGGRRGALAGALAGALGALAVATCLVHAFQLFPILDQEL